MWLGKQRLAVRNASAPLKGQTSQKLLIIYRETVPERNQRQGKKNGQNQEHQFHDGPHLKDQDHISTRSENLLANIWGPTDDFPRGTGDFHRLRLRRCPSRCDSGRATNGAPCHGPSRFSFFYRGSRGVLGNSPWEGRENWLVGGCEASDGAPGGPCKVVE